VTLGAGQSGNQGQGNIKKTGASAASDIMMSEFNKGQEFFVLRLQDLMIEK